MQKIFLRNKYLPYAISYKNKFFNINPTINEIDYEYENYQKNNIVNNKRNNLSENNYENGLLTQNQRYSSNVNIINDGRNYRKYKDKFKKMHIKDVSMPVIVVDYKNIFPNIDYSQIIGKNNRKQKFETISDQKYNRVYIKRNIKDDSSSERMITKPNYSNSNRLFKSQSEINILSNNTNNSNNNDYLIPYNYNRNQYVGTVKERTDITNNELFDKYKIGNNKEYMDYKDKYKEIFLINKFMVEHKNQENKIKNNYIILSERNKYKKENDDYNKLIMQDKIFDKEKKINYRKMLDNQVKHIIESKLSNENLSYKDFIKNNAYDRQKMKTPIREFLNKNDYVDVNPYNNRGNYLGESNLQNNTILNPRIQFKLNKYIFPTITDNKYTGRKFKY